MKPYNGHIELKKSDFIEKVVVFQGIGFEGYRFMMILEEKPKEIFPGIYMHKEVPTGLLHLFNELRGIEDSIIVVDNRNRKDMFAILGKR